MGKWYIGQEIICIESHEEGEFKYGQIFKIISLSLSHCKCEEIDINIGHIYSSYVTERRLICQACNTDIEVFENIVWYSETYFAPLEELMNEEIESIKEQLKISI